MPKKMYCFVRSKKIDQICYTKKQTKKKQVINPKKGQRISGQGR
jgi:hypothetical protein